MPNIEFLGQVAPQKALEIVANASLLLSTADEEGFPNTFLEAWASGTPVVSLNVDPDRLIERYSLGCVSKSVEDVGREIVSLLGSPARRDQISLRARIHVARHHSAAAVVSAFRARSG